MGAECCGNDFQGEMGYKSCGAYSEVAGACNEDVEKVLERRMRHMLKVDKMQFGFMPGKGTTDTMFILRRLQKEYSDKEKKLYTCMCFVDLENALDRVLRKVLERAMMKRGIPDAKTRVKEFEVQVGVYQGSMLSQ